MGKWDFFETQCSFPSAFEYVFMMSETGYQYCLHFSLQSSAWSI